MSISGKLSIQKMDSKSSSNAPGQQFAFVLVNHAADDEKQASLKDIRAHAMREALRQKKLAKPTPENVEPLPYRTGRFRLAPTQPKSRKQKANSSAATRASVCTESQEEGKEHVHKDVVASSSLARLESNGLLDPFDTFPIKLGLRQQRLLYYCKSRFSYCSEMTHTDNELGSTDYHSWHI